MKDASSCNTSDRTSDQNLSTESTSLFALNRSTIRKSKRLSNYNSRTCPTESMANAWRLNTTNPRLNIWREKATIRQHGARPVKRAIQKQLLQNLSTEILKGKFNEDDTILVTADRHGLCLANGQKIVRKIYDITRSGGEDLGADFRDKTMNDQHTTATVLRRNKNNNKTS